MNSFGMNLQDLNDVAIDQENLQNQDYLRYESETGKWVNDSSSGGSIEIEPGTGIVCNPNPIVGTGTISLGDVGPGASTITNVQNVTINAQGQVTDLTSYSVGPVIQVLGSSGNILVSGSTTSPVVNLATAGNAGSFSYPSSLTTDTYGRVTSISNGSPVLSVTGGTNVTITGTSQNPIINASGGSSSNSCPSYMGAKILSGFTLPDNSSFGPRQQILQML